MDAHTVIDYHEYANEILTSSSENILRGSVAIDNTLIIFSSFQLKTPETSMRNTGIFSLYLHIPKSVTRDGEGCHRATCTTGRSVSVVGGYTPSVTPHSLSVLEGGVSMSLTVPPYSSKDKNLEVFTVSRRRRWLL